MNKINPLEDGITHINIYSKGKTELGRLLSNFAHTPVDLGIDGHFQSLEGYWYWLLSENSNKFELRYVDGFDAKRLGRFFTQNKDWPTKEELRQFKDKFMDAMEKKLIQHPHIFEMLRESTLPFKHYYVYGDKVVSPKGCKWQLDFWDGVRNFYQDLLYES